MYPFVRMKESQCAITGKYVKVTGDVSNFPIPVEECKHSARLLDLQENHRLQIRKSSKTLHLQEKALVPPCPRN